MKYYIIAGEASGDLHGSNLIRGLLKANPDAEFRFWGGDLMAEAGGRENLARHYKTASFFGFLEVITHARTILSQIRECKRDIEKFAPDVLVLIDYPGFNFRMAKFAHNRGIRTFYYISPKVWAWKESRVELIRKYVDRLFIIFPFETEYFAKKGIETIYEGNPLVEVIEHEKMTMPERAVFLETHGLPDDKPLIALLAGSRESEIRYNLPFMVDLSRRFPEYRFVVAGVDWLEPEVYDKYLAGSDVSLIWNGTYPLLRYSDAAVVTSGTATLETALMGTPEFVCYRRDKLSMNIGRLIIKVRFISLVNLILNREAVRELIQWDMTMPMAEAELRSILPGGEKRERMIADYEELGAVLGGPGASERVAKTMVDLLKEEKK